MPENETTTPAIQAPMGQISPIKPEIVVNTPPTPPAPEKEANMAMEVHKRIKPSMIRYPLYEYQTGSMFYLSKRETIAADAFLKTNNVTEATRVLNEIGRAHGSKKTFSASVISRWLKKPHVARHIAREQVKRGKVNWYDELQWKAWGADVMEGKMIANSVQAIVWKEYGKSQGWYKEPAASTNALVGVQINFSQQDGRA